MKDLEKTKNDLKYSLSSLKKEYYKLSAEERGSDIGVNLRELIKDATIHLKGEQVIQCNSQQGLAIGLIDSIGYICHSLSMMNINLKEKTITKDIKESLIDLSDNKCFSDLISLIEDVTDLRHK